MYVPPIESDPAADLRDLLDDLLFTAEREGSVHVTVTLTRGGLAEMPGALPHRKWATPDWNLRRDRELEEARLALAEARRRSERRLDLLWRLIRRDRRRGES
ncbi:hypothetical protein ACT1U9_32935 (plasmid) [Streptomyces sp. BR1]|uniref:hypothetical protein n=1 Tax=Streptomyces sp. BR1 TaxID=1592323 RepID=UPI00402BB41C